MDILVGILIAGLIGAAIGQTRGRKYAGFWYGFLLGPIGWLALLVGPNPKKEKEEAERRALESRMQKMQEAHLAELRALRGSLAAPKAAAVEDMYWVRVKDRELGPISKLELLEFYAAGKVTLETEVARDVGSEDRLYRTLSDEVPVLKKT